MSSFFSNAFRGKTTESDEQTPPVHDAPLESLPNIEVHALDQMQEKAQYLFSNLDGTLDHEDPWKNLSSELRSLLLLRFLRYQQLNVTNAMEHMLRVAKWRNSQRPWTLPLTSVQGKAAGIPIIIPPGRGRRNEIVLYVASCLYEKSDVDSKLQEIGMYALFEYCSYAVHGKRANAGILVIDLNDMLFRNLDLFALRSALKVFFEYYPEVFSKILLLNYPRWAHGTYRLISPLLDARTVHKLEWITGKDSLVEELHQFFDHSSIPWWLGGGDPTQPDKPFCGSHFDAKKCLNSLG